MFRFPPTCRRRLLLCLLAAVAVVLTTMLAGAGAPALADPMPRPVILPPPPPGPPVLAVESPSGPRTFSVADLEALGLHEMDADLVWPGENDTYQGVLFSAVLKAAGMADALAVRVTALDGYSAVIPAEDWVRWPLLLATRRAGQPMAVRDKGPLRILYPLTPTEVLASPEMDVRWVWMVSAIAPAAPPAPAAGGSGG